MHKPPVPCSNRQFGVRALGVLIACCLAALAVAGCGGGGSSSSSTAATESSGGATESTSAGSFDPTQYEKLLEEPENPSTQFPELPEAPAPKAGAKVVGIWCSLALEGCSAASKVFSGAAESLGWNPTVLDTESKPSKIEASFHQAVNLGAEGIIMEAISPWSLVEPLVNEAKEAGAPSVCFSCDAAGEQTGTATEPTTALSAEVSNADEKQGELSAAQLILAAEGNADILFLSDPEYEATHLSEVGFHKLFDACEGCKISKELKFTGAELTTTVGAQIKAALTADPEIEYVWSPAGAFLPPAVIPAIEQLGSSTDVQVFCVAGQKAELEGVAEGGIIGGTTFTPEGWAIYAAVDQMNRILAGKPTVKEDVVPTYAVNSENVHLFLNSRESPVHYEEGFHKLWGVE